MYIHDLLLTFIILGVALALIGAGYLVGNIVTNPSEASYEKVSTYECGFEAFSDAREPFDVKFYLIAILFIIFDVEVIFFFPWILSLKDTYYYGFYVMLIFMVILMVGFAYEWRKGCMDWD